MARWIFTDPHKGSGLRGKGNNACVPASIATVTGMDYREVYETLQERQQEWATSGRTSKAKRRAAGKTIASEGVHKPVYKAYLEEHGWEWVPLMKPGARDRNPRLSDLPQEGRFIASVSRHLTAFIDGVIHDTHDPSRGDTRTVYGYYRLATTHSPNDTR